jgi:hypothetical protein
MKRENVLIDLMDPARATLKGILHLPEEPKALVILVHSNDTDSANEHNTYVIQALNRRDMIVLSINLLTPVEAEVYQNRFNASLLGDRLVSVTQWAMQQETMKSLPVGYYGDNTGAASALKAAAILDGHIKAIVSFNGHPELARHALSKVTAAILLIAAELDTQSVYLNQIAYDQLKTKRKMIIVKEATSAFEEIGVFEKAADLAGNWLDEHLLWPLLSAEVKS